MGPSGEPRWKITPKSATEYDVKVVTTIDRHIFEDGVETVKTYSFEKYFTFKVISLKNTSTISGIYDTGFGWVSSSGLRGAYYEIIAGNTPTVNCASKGRKAGYQYKVVYKRVDQDYDEEELVVQNRSTNKTVKLPVLADGDYRVKVIVRDADGYEVTKEYSLIVYPKAKNTSSLAKTSIVQGSNLKINCSQADILCAKVPSEKVKEGSMKYRYL